MTQNLIAPFMTGTDGSNVIPDRWKGRNQIKPWQRKVTATFAHLETPELVPHVVGLLRLQTARPHIIVVDTGSTKATCDKLEENRAEDVEIHYIRSHGYRNSSAPVAVACDLAQALMLTEYTFWTHCDVFLRKRTYIEERIAQCSPKTPVVGYEMSPRDWLTDQWRGMVSHTASVSHVPTFNRLGITWSFERAHTQFGIARSGMSWPDTETGMNLQLRALGIPPVLIGKETNYERHVDDNLDHCRSFPGSLLYSDTHYRKARKWIDQAIVEAQERIREWEPLAKYDQQLKSRPAPVLAGRRPRGLM